MNIIYKEDGGLQGITHMLTASIEANCDQELTSEQHKQLTEAIKHFFDVVQMINKTN